VVAITARNYVALANYVSPMKGVRFSPYAFVHLNSDIVLRAAEIKNIPIDSKSYLWGYYDGSGKPINLPVVKYFDQFVSPVDFSKAPEMSYNRIIGKGNTLNNVFEVYPGAIVAEYHYPGFEAKYGGMDWKSLRLVFENEGDQWRLVGIISDRWTI
jgi:hypothetical protein